jgi:ABC-type lipoprotein release transport system permease subunit
MKMYLTLAWRNVWRNKRRSIITIISIAFAVLLACIMRSMQLGSYERMIENAARFYTGYIQIHKKGYWDDKVIDNVFNTNSSLVTKVEHINGVEAIVPRVESFALASYETKTKGAMVLGIDPEKENALTRPQKKLVRGSYLVADDKSVMVGEGLANYLGISLQDTLVLISQGYHGANAAGIYPVKGILKFPVPEQNNQTVLMPLKETQWFYNLENQLTSLALVIDKADHVKRISREINTQIDTAAMEVMGWEEMMPDLVQGIEIDNISGKVMLWILYAVIGFGMFGTFLMMTAERMYEFGVMMSVGMKRLIMQFIIFLEMVMMTSIGTLLGVIISLPIITYYFHHPIYLSGESAKAFETFDVEPAYFFSLEPSLFFFQAWAIFLMAIILGLYPLIVIGKLQPVKAMRESI